PDSIKDLKLAAILHDVGKIGISEAILIKPAQLSLEEQEIITHHPGIGVKIVDSILHSKRFIHGIGDHHEFYNGKGYPKGLKKEEISLQGRIIAVADALDALSSDRAYRKGMSLPDSCKEIKSNIGIQFDPNVVEAFLRAYKKKPEIFNG
ncbi:MAG: HD domain-containing phosphohydrolase, partial [Candidatus Omnitrophota bacterium]